MDNLPTLRQMQYLLALETHLNFQKAAAACNVTQSTLSGGLRDMEGVLGADVIDRRDRRVVRFTPLGLDMLACAKDMVERTSALTRRARQSGPFSWPLRLGVIPTVAPYLLPRLLKPLQTALPGLDLQIHETRSPDLVQKIHDGALDLALMAFPFETKGLAEKTVLTEEFLCAAPPGFFARQKSLTLRDLDDKNLLLLEDGHCLRDQTLEACRLRPIKEQKAFSAASLQTLIHLVHQGYGVTFLPAMAARDSSLPRGLTLRPFSSGAPSRKIGFAWKKGGFLEKDIRLVIGACEKILRN